MVSRKKKHGLVSRLKTRVIGILRLQQRAMQRRPLTVKNVTGNRNYPSYGDREPSHIEPELNHVLVLMPSHLSKSRKRSNQDGRSQEQTLKALKASIVPNIIISKDRNCLDGTTSLDRGHKHMILNITISEHRNKGDCRHHGR